MAWWISLRASFLSPPITNMRKWSISILLIFVGYAIYGIYLIFKCHTTFFERVLTCDICFYDFCSFIRPRHQSVFSVGENWTPDLLFNYQKLYQLSWLKPTKYHTSWLPTQCNEIFNTLMWFFFSYIYIYIYFFKHEIW